MLSKKVRWEHHEYENGRLVKKSEDEGKLLQFVSGTQYGWIYGIVQVGDSFVMVPLAELRAVRRKVPAPS